MILPNARVAPTQFGVGSNYRNTYSLGPAQRAGLDASQAAANYRQNNYYPAMRGIMDRAPGLLDSYSQRATDSNVSSQINTNPIYTPQQTREQVNLAQALNDQRTATDINQLQGQFAARGMGQNSPLLQALTLQRQAANPSSEHSGSDTVPI